MSKFWRESQKVMSCSLKIDIYVTFAIAAYIDSNWLEWIFLKKYKKVSAPPAPKKICLTRIILENPVGASRGRLKTTEEEPEETLPWKWGAWATLPLPRILPLTVICPIVQNYPIASSARSKILFKVFFLNFFLGFGRPKADLNPRMNSEEKRPSQNSSRSLLRNFYLAI